VFALQTAQTAAERMDALECFIEFWFGPRRPEFGEPQSALCRVRLPEPLRRLYAFAGRWPLLTRSDGQTLRIFCTQDSLRSLSEVELSADGKVIFLDENQGVWACATEAVGDDPPVWVADRINDDRLGKWRLAAPSLSSFLVTFCLQESTFGAYFDLADDDLETAFNDNAHDAVPLWLEGPYAWGREYDFLLWRGTILVFLHGGSYSFAARNDEGMEFLTQHQSPIGSLRLHFGGWNFNTIRLGYWELNLDSTGGGNIRHSSSDELNIAFAPGTLDFEDVRDQFLEECADQPPSEDVVVLFLRTGNGNAKGRGPRNIAVVGDLLRRILKAIPKRTPAFDRLLRERPPAGLQDLI
jgi:hypothetical protein